MYFLRTLLLASIISSFLLLKATCVSAANESPSPTPDDSSYIKRYPYQNAPAQVFAKKGKASGAKGENLFSTHNLLTQVLPSVAGVIGIFGGGFFTWFRIKKSDRMFKSYLKKITDAQMAYQSAIENKTQSAKKASSIYKTTLKKLLEETEMAAANKNISQEHLTVIAHKIDRELNGGGSKSQPADVSSVPNT